MDMLKSASLFLQSHSKRNNREEREEIRPLSSEWEIQRCASLFAGGKVRPDTDYEWELVDMLHLTKAEEKDDWFLQPLRAERENGKPEIGLQKSHAKSLVVKQHKTSTTSSYICLLLKNKTVRRWSIFFSHLLMQALLVSNCAHFMKVCISSDVHKDQLFRCNSAWPTFILD